MFNEYSIIDAVIMAIYKVICGVYYLFASRPKIEKAPQDKTWV